MLLSELSGKEIIDLRKAEKLGLLGQTDLEIDETTGQITALLISTSQWFGFKKKGSEVRVPWSHIHRIGEDMIMIDVPSSGNIDNTRG